MLNNNNDKLWADDILNYVGVKISTTWNRLPAGTHVKVVAEEVIEALIESTYLPSSKKLDEDIDLHYVRKYLQHILDAEKLPTYRGIENDR